MGRASSKEESKAKRQNPVQIFTDGCHWGEFGAYAAVFIQKRQGVDHVLKLKSSHKYGNTTSNRMELRAVLASLKRVGTGFRIDIYSDSTYCVDNLKRLKRWEFTGRLKSVKNRDLWTALLQEIKRHEKEGSILNYTWIRGHAGHKWNEMAHELAQDARSTWDVKSCVEQW